MEILWCKGTKYFKNLQKGTLDKALYVQYKEDFKYKIVPKNNRKTSNETERWIKKNNANI